MSTATRHVTADELLRMPDDGYRYYRYELVEGELRKMTPAGFEHGYIISGDPVVSGFTCRVGDNLVNR